MHNKPSTWLLISLMIAFLTTLLLLVACGTPTVAPTPVRTALSTTATPISAPTDEYRGDELSDEQVATLRSLEQVDDYPLYVVHYYGDYERPASSTGAFEWRVDADPSNPGPATLPPAWACSLFTTLGEAGPMHYGRNFDWEYSPAVLLFTDPPDGYASVSMVDIAYLFGPTAARSLTDLSLDERNPLLHAPLLPFDGMNEHGLAVAMAAVPGYPMPYDADKETVDSLMIIRQILDHARDVDEAIAIVESYNIRWGSGPPLHYLIADTSGQSVLVEFYEGEMVVIPNEVPWHLATNHLRTIAEATGEWDCWRYDRIHQRLTETEGQLTAQEAMDLLNQVSQPATQWSVVYGMSTGDINVVMGRQYDNVHSFQLSLGGE